MNPNPPAADRQISGEPPIKRPAPLRTDPSRDDDEDDDKEESRDLGLTINAWSDLVAKGGRRGR